MGLTAEGLVVDKYNEITQAIQTSQQELISPDIDISEDTLLGQYTSIIAEREAALNELVQAVYDARSLNKAEGQALDDLVQILNIVRQQAQKTSGLECFKGVDGTALSSGLQVKNPVTTDVYELVNSITLDAQACIGVDITVGVVSDNTLYNLTVDGVSISFTSSGAATVDEVVTTLNAQINIKTGVNFNSTEDDVTLAIRSIDGSPINVVLGTTILVIGDVYVNSTIQALETGSLVSGPNTVTEIINTTFGLNSVTNTLALTTGRDIETDEELRERAKLSGAASGKATLDSIISALLSVPLVTTSTVEENVTMVTDGNGLPPKSYRTVVVGGTDDDVAQSIWDTKPAGIETDGNTPVSTATDYFGNTHTVNFSRSTPIPIYVEVVYTLYNEEAATADIETVIADAIEAEFVTLGVGNDVIPKRFYGAVYAATTGIEELTINMSTAPSPTTETPIAIAAIEIATLSLPVSVTL